MSFLELQKENESKLRNFLEFFELSLCKRCWAATYNDFSRPYHTHGGLLEILNGIEVDAGDIEKWTMELEHGFLHSFMVLYFAYCLYPKKDVLWDSVFQFNMRRPSSPRISEGDRLVASCLMHDFMRMVGDGDRHDERLRYLSEHLLDVTYRHSNPLERDEISPLIGADRIELMRYEDHREWCDFDLLSPYVDAYGGRPLLDHFFEHIRPAFVRMFEGRREVWISHVLETNAALYDNKGVGYFPKSHWRAADNGYGRFEDAETGRYMSVNLGKLPCSGCLKHTSKDRTRGLLKLSDLKCHGAELRCAPPSTAGRDHPFLFYDKPIDLRCWTFVCPDIQQTNLFDTDEFVGVSEDIFNTVFRLSEDFLTKFIALST